MKEGKQILDKVSGDLMESMDTDEKEDLRACLIGAGILSVPTYEELEKQVEELEELNKALEEKVNDLALQDFIEKTLGGYSHEYLRRHAQQLQAKALAEGKAEVCECSDGNIVKDEHGRYCDYCGLPIKESE